MIALITDFGSNDYFTGVVKGVIKNINPMVEIVDINNNISSFSIVNAQFVLYSSYKFFPVGTIFFVVVDPGVGTERPALIAVDEKYTFILPDNGILTSVIHKNMNIYKINENLFDNISSTFHGRDVFAPVAAYLSLGKKPDSLGVKISDIVKIEFPQYKIGNRNITGLIQHIDKFGNLITSIPNSMFNKAKYSSAIIKYKNNKIKALVCNTYGDLKKGIGILYGSAGFLELVMNMKSLSEKYKVKIGDRLVITYE